MPFLPASRDCLARCVSSVGWHVGLFSLGLNTYGERGRGGGGEGGREEREEGEKKRGGE